MSILFIEHVQLAMPAGREAEARAFYAGVLGIREVEKPDHLKARGGCWFEDGPVRIHLGVDPDFRPAAKAHPAFMVENARAMERKIALAGYLAVRDEPLKGFDRFYALDPFGNRLEFMQAV